MRIQATVPAVLGTTPDGLGVPCVPFAGKDVGMFFLPPRAPAVWIEFEGGDINLPDLDRLLLARRASPRPRRRRTCAGIVTAGERQAAVRRQRGQPA